MNKKFIEKVFSGHLIDSIHLRLLENRWRLISLMPSMIYSNEKIDRPIFILGTQGGGLTFVGRVLRRCDGVFSMASDNSYWNSKDEMHIHMDTALPELLRLRHSTSRKSLNISEVFNYANNSCLKYFRATPDDVTTRDTKSFLNTLKGLQWLIANRNTRPRFIDKSQSYTIKVGYLNSLLSGLAPMFLLVSRNPIAICAREANKVKTDGGTVSAFETRISECAAHWSNSFKLALDDVENYGLADRFKAVQIEEVLLRPEKHIRNLCEFLGLRYDSAILPKENDDFRFPHTRDNKWYPIRTAANDKYINLLSESQISIILDHCGETMLRLGYSVDVDNL